MALAWWLLWNTEMGERRKDPISLAFNAGTGEIMLPQGFQGGAQVKWNYIYLPPRPPHSDGRGVTPFIFASSLHWFFRRRNVVFNITLTLWSHFRHYLRWQVWPLHIGVFSPLVVPRAVESIVCSSPLCWYFPACPLLPNAQSPDGTSCLLPAAAVEEGKSTKTHN